MDLQTGGSWDRAGRGLVLISLSFKHLEELLIGKAPWDMLGSQPAAANVAVVERRVEDPTTFISPLSHLLESLHQRFVPLSVWITPREGHALNLYTPRPTQVLGGDRQ